MIGKIFLTKSGDGFRNLKIKESNSFNKEPFRTLPNTELQLGSQDLVRLAEYSLSKGFRIISFNLKDKNLEFISYQKEEEVSKSLVQLIEKYGELEIASALRDEYKDMYVVGINLLNPTGLTLSIYRRGFIETSYLKENAENFLLEAWNRLKLS